MRVVIYVRVSTQEQAREGYSIGEQLERLKMYSKAMNWTIVETYVDPGYSGASLQRPALQQMIQDIKSENIDKVVVYKLDRLSRSQKDTLFLIEDVFLKNNTDFVSMNENFDTSTPFGRAMIGILAVFAQLDREQIKERLTMGREARAKDGYYTAGGNQLIGYDYVNGELMVNEYEKMLINEIFDEFNNGTPINTIVNNLNERGYNHKSGEWNDFTLKRCLKNRHYIGEVKFAGIWYPGRHTAIVKDDVFNKAQTLLKYRKDNYKFDNKHTSYLGGFIWCKNCGARYHRQLWKPKLDNTRTAQYTCYSRSKKQKNMIKDPNCKNKIYKTVELEEKVFNEIRKLALDPDYLNEARGDNNTDDSTAKKIKLLHEEIKELTDQISNFMDLYSIKRLTLQEVDAKIEPLADRRHKLEDELETLTESVDEDALTNDEIIRLVTSFGKVVDDKDINEVRLIISTLIKRIEIDGDDIYIKWNFS